MPDVKVKISELPPALAVNDDDQYESSQGGTSRKQLFSQIAARLEGKGFIKEAPLGGVTYERADAHWTDSGAVNVRSSPFNAGGGDTGDDTAALTAAVAYAQTNSKRLVIPPGVYRITQEIPVTMNGLQINMQGEIKQMTYGFGGFDCNNCNGWRIFGGGKFTQPNVKTPITGGSYRGHLRYHRMTGIFAYGCSDWIVDDLNFEGWAVAVHSTPIYPEVIRNSRFRVSNIYSTHHEFGVVPVGSEDFVIHNIRGGITEFLSQPYDPPHLIYLSSFATLRNRNAVVSNCVGTSNTSSSDFKLAVTDGLTVSNLTSRGASRGIEFGDATKFRASNLVVTEMNPDTATDGDLGACLNFALCVDGEVINFHGDVPDGFDFMHGVLIREDNSDVIARNGLVSVSRTGTAGTTAAVTVRGQRCRAVDVEVWNRNNLDKIPFELRNGTDCALIRPRMRQTASLTRMVSVASDMVNGKIELDLDIMGTSWANNTITDAGTGTQVSFLGRLPNVTLANLPTATLTDDNQAIVSDAPGLKPLAVNIAGTWRYTDGSLALPAAVAANTYGLDAFGDLSTSLGFANAINAAATHVGARGGGVVLIPPRTYRAEVFPANIVGTNQGAMIKMGYAMSNITWLGAGPATVIKPIANTIELFVIVGAENTAFARITFDNSENGTLQYQVKPVSETPGGGIAGRGNNANSAISQFYGANLAVGGCNFIDFIIGVEYIGDYTDNSQLVGVAVVIETNFDGCVQGFLPCQPKKIIMADCDYSNGITSYNADLSNDPGHAIYVSDRTGAYPQTIVISNVTGTNNEAEAVRVRKGESVTVTNCPVHASHRGHNFENCKSLTVVGCTIRLADILDADNNASALFLADCGNYRIAECVLDIQNTNAYALRVVSGGAVNSWNNCNGVIENITIFNNALGDNLGKDWCVTDGQTDVTFRNIRGHLTANTGQNKPILNITSGTRIQVLNPSKRTAAVGSPAGSDRLVNISAGVTGTKVEWNRLGIDVTPTANTIIDAGTGTLIMRTDGTNKGTWTPVTTFATPGDWAPTYSRQQGVWERQGEWCTIAMNLVFTANAWTTASGAFQITGLPFTAAADLDIFYAALGNWQKVTIGTVTDAELFVSAGTNLMSLRASSSASTGATLTQTSFPASTTSIAINAVFRYKIVEP